MEYTDRMRCFLKSGDCLYSLVYLFLITVCMSAWHALATHAFSPAAFLFFLVLSGSSLIYGRLVLRLLPRASEIKTGLTLQFLCGYFALNTFGFVMSFFTHFTIMCNSLILCGLGAGVLVSCPRRELRKYEWPAFQPELLCLILCGIGTTLWCADALNPIVVSGHGVIFQTWMDSFFHAREISLFSQSHGLNTISDMQMAGAPATIYHYASYVSSAAAVSATDTSSYEIFAGFYLPFGLLLTGFAAFCLTSRIWGSWPGVAGVAAVMLLPDAYQQGFQNKFMGYNFLQQVNPGGLYGVAIIAIAWMLILDGCKMGKLATVFLGYGIALVSLSYKAQIFVGNAFLVMIYPCLFFTGIKGKWRAIAGFLLVALFVFVVHLSQHSSAVPTLRLDGSGAKRYAFIILGSSDHGFFEHLFLNILTGLPSPLFELALACMIVITTFGFWIAGFGVLFYFCRKNHVADRWFPLLVIANYIIMAVGLAVDEKQVGMPEELLHRPLVWAYFAVVAWTGAATYALLAGDQLPKKRAARILAYAVLFLCLLFPLNLSPNIQTMSVWTDTSDYRQLNSFSLGLLKASLYIRAKSKVTDLIQDSEDDSRLMVTAMAERQDFAIHSGNGEGFRIPQGLRARLKEMARFRQMTDESGLLKFAAENHISWYLLHPETKVAWPASLLNKPVFSSEGYRVYHFPGEAGL